VESARNQVVSGFNFKGVISVTNNDRDRLAEGGRPGNRGQQGFNAQLLCAFKIEGAEKTFTREMAARPLSLRERQAIEAILAQAENEFLPGPASIGDIDSQCKSLWPDWNPAPPSVADDDMDMLKLQVRRLMERIGGAAIVLHSPPPAEQPNEAPQVEQSGQVDTERATRDVEKENRRLRQELQEMKRSYEQSRVEIAELKKALRMRRAVREKVTAAGRTRR
jgi:hypothetical protein